MEGGLSREGRQGRPSGSLLVSRVESRSPRVKRRASLISIISLAFRDFDFALSFRSAAAARASGSASACYSGEAFGFSLSCD